MDFNKPKPIPTFERWLENQYGHYGIGNDVKLSDDLGLRGWYFDAYGLGDSKRTAFLKPEDMIAIPIGDYKLIDRDSNYALLQVKDDVERSTYLVKRGDFEMLKDRIKN